MLYRDSHCAIRLSESAGMHRQNIHIAIIYHHIRDAEAQKEIKIKNERTDDMISDIIAKSFWLLVFSKLIDFAGFQAKDDIYNYWARGRVGETWNIFQNLINFCVRMKQKCYQRNIKLWLSLSGKFCDLVCGMSQVPSRRIHLNQLTFRRRFFYPGMKSCFLSLVTKLYEVMQKVYKCRAKSVPRVCGTELYSAKL